MQKSTLYTYCIIIEIKLKIRVDKTLPLCFTRYPTHYSTGYIMDYSSIELIAIVAYTAILAIHPIIWSLSK